ncbi:hypothetical protein BDB00DRAFT_876138 [Zychaea mexicana]|uniref:uncharacterized protein n=1 Tax=Zychaea mexicana TaxID=64656 RepID=UPI0022FE755C|nr:uncharacterized protein BDB00DRAFT_876138 [Zychaea mexicana]KAI9489705.1 hypothetical protein BDB00DRAFT_876138 [Zychaea mexicana]
MPFLLKYLNQIKHESALQMLATEQSEETLNLGLADMEESIRMATGRNGVHFGETINLYGPSGGGKTWALTVLAEHVLRHSNESVIYMDLDGRFIFRRQEQQQQPVDNERFHLFQPKRAQLLATVQGVDEWLYRHTDTRVTMVLVDGAAALDATLMETLRRYQHKWSYVLVTTSSEPQPNAQCNYRFHVYKNVNTNQVEMKLAWPSMSSSTVSSTTKAFPVTMTMTV